jgi:hypothetical protein
MIGDQCRPRSASPASDLTRLRQTRPCVWAGSFRLPGSRRAAPAYARRAFCDRLAESKVASASLRP